MNTDEIHSSKTRGAVANQFGFKSIKKLDETEVLWESGDRTCHSERSEESAVLKSGKQIPHVVRNDKSGFTLRQFQSPSSFPFPLPRSH